MPHDWFPKLTGFREERYELTQSQLAIEGDELVSTVNGKRYGIGSLSLTTLAELRARVEIPMGRGSSVRCVTGEARAGRVPGVVSVRRVKHFRTGWEVQTAHPISGTGVVYLDKQGRRHAAPLNIADLGS
jgi:hypothetical protein